MAPSLRGFDGDIYGGSRWGFADGARAHLQMRFCSREKRVTQQCHAWYTSRHGGSSRSVLDSDPLKTESDPLKHMEQRA